MTDSELIENHGGPTKVAEILNMKPSRVCNWMDRGIPPKVKLEHPELFLPNMKQLRKKKNSQQLAG